MNNVNTARKRTATSVTTEKKGKAPWIKKTKFIHAGKTEN